jgi:cytidylate kinase
MHRLSRCVDEFSKREKKKRPREPCVICVCGMAGSGKSTAAKRVAKEYKMKYFSGGDALMALAIEEGYRPCERGWWEGKEGLSFLKRRGKDPQFDEAVDGKLLQVAEEGNVVLDSWTMPWLLKTGFKIWLDASVEKRAERIAERDKASCREALEALKSKEGHTKAIYKKMYGFKLGEDLEPFNFILDTENLSAPQVFQILRVVIESLVLK